MARSFVTSAAEATVMVAVATFVGACVWLLLQQLSRGLLSAAGSVVDRIALWRDGAEAARDAEPQPTAAPGASLGPYRTPAFLVEPEPDPTNAEDRATS